MRPILLLILLIGCTKEPSEDVPAVEEVAAGDCSEAKNECPDYSTMWVQECPEGERCLTFKNSCAGPVALAYQIGCNGDGTKGAPQCDCTDGPVLTPGATMYFHIIDGNFESCIPSWQPACLTEGLAIMANPGTDPVCTEGSRIEFSAGNQADMYGKFDSYDLDIEKGWYAVPVTFRPDLECATDHGGHDCRQVWCNSEECPDAYADPTSGGCEDGRSPQVGCQDTFGQSVGLTVEFCPADCKVSGGACPSCQDAKACDG